MYKVLIVEDDPMVAMINAQYIKRNKQFEVVGQCPDGAAALAFLETTDVNLLILDVYMPHMDGFETLRQIRNRQITADAIMVTAANDREAVETALHLGIVDYLVKPFTFDRFQMALEKFIAQDIALKERNTLNQTNIDHIIESTRKKSDDLFPKGIQKKTLQLILSHLDKHETCWFTGDEIAKEVGLTGVTARRYLSHLAETGAVTGAMNYDTGGRPCMQYKISK